MSNKHRVLWVGEANYLNTGYSRITREILKRLYESNKYEIAELAIWAYMDENHNQMPWRFYPNGPDRRNKEECQLYENDHINKFGKYKFERVCVDFQPDTVCVPPNELVATKLGYRPISDIVIGDEVLTHKHRFRKVTRTFKRKYSGKLIKICGTYGLPIITTPEHPLLLSNNNKYVPAQNIKLGDQLTLPIYPQNIETSTYYIRDNFVQLNTDLASLLGLFMGGGSETNGTIFIQLNSQSIADDHLKRIIKQYFGAHCSINNDLFMCNSIAVYDFIDRVIGIHNKRVPPEIFTASNQIVKVFLREWFASDGTNAIKHADYISLMLNRKKIRSDSAISIEEIDYDGDVHNIEVEQDNTYCLSYVVHNCDIRDPFMCSFLMDSPYRPNYNLVFMPTIDATPQNDEWLFQYQQCDVLCTYTKWGATELRGQLKKTKSVVYDIPPCPDYGIFSPQDRSAIRKHYELDESAIILGMVARNNPRKAFNDLCDAFHTLYEKSNQNLYLYLHTSYPDMGWDIATFLKEYNLSSRVLFSYYCNACHYFRPRFFMDATAVCPKCNRSTFKMMDVTNPIPDQLLAHVYNIMDALTYISLCEGFGIGIVEAAACGVPVFCTNYSAMEDFPESLGAYPINVIDKYRESSTGRFFAMTDKNDLIKKVNNFIHSPAKMRNVQRLQIANKCRQSYNWDVSAAKWANIIDQMPQRDLNKTWHGPSRAHQPPKQIPGNVNNAFFVSWAITNVLGRPDLSHSFFADNLLKDLNNGFCSRGSYVNMFNDLSLSGGMNSFVEFNRDTLLQILYDRRQYWNQLEEYRVQNIKW